jgi:hypothetical protein
LAPRLSLQPTVSGNAANRQLKLTFFPDIWKKQLDDKKVEIHVGGMPFNPDTINQDTTGVLTVSIVGAAPSDAPVPVTLRVDGVVSELIRDRKSAIKKFDPMQTIKLT